MSVSDVTRYRWSRAYGVRFLGGATIALGVLWVVAAFAGFADWSLVLLAAGGALLVACGLRFVWLPPVLLEVSSTGYRVVGVRGGGVTSASWAEVETVTATSADDGPVVQISLRNGEATTVPVALLGGDALAAEREMHNRLNAAFGYRRLRRDPTSAERPA